MASIFVKREGSNRGTCSILIDDEEYRFNYHIDSDNMLIRGKLENSTRFIYECAEEWASYMLRFLRISKKDLSHTNELIALLADEFYTVLQFAIQGI